MEYDESYEELENISIPSMLVLKVGYTKQVVDWGESEDDIGEFDEQKIFIVNLKFAYSHIGLDKKIVIMEMQESANKNIKNFYAAYTNKECFYLPSVLCRMFEEYLTDIFEDGVEINNISLVY